MPSFVYSNNALTTISNSISDSDTTIEIEDSSNFPSLGTDEVSRAFLLDKNNNYELIDITDVDSDTLTVERGKEGTTAQSFDSGTDIGITWTAETIDSEKYTSDKFDSDFNSKTTDDLDEGSSNLYYSDSRAREALSASGDLSYDSDTGEFSVTTYSSSDFDSDFGDKTTDDLSEGSSNQYYTDGRAQDSVGNIITGENDASVTYDDSEPSITIDVTVPVDSVAGKTGEVSLDSSDVGLGDVTNDAQLKQSSNLDDLDNVSTARSNLGLGSAATQDVGTGSSDVPQNNDLGSAAYDDASDFADANHTHDESDISGLATVATSGDYDDLSNKPDLSDYLEDAPSDDKLYARRNGEWEAGDLFTVDTQNVIDWLSSEPRSETEVQDQLSVPSWDTAFGSILNNSSDAESFANSGTAVSNVVQIQSRAESIVNNNTSLIEVLKSTSGSDSFWSSKNATLEWWETGETDTEDDDMEFDYPEEDGIHVLEIYMGEYTDDYSNSTWERDIDLSDVSEIKFKILHDYGIATDFIVDGDSLFSEDEEESFSDYKDVSVDVSDYSGVNTITFQFDSSDIGDDKTDKIKDFKLRE